VLAVVQFDAVSLPVLERLLGDGRLPTLARLRSSGEWLDLKGPSGHLEGAVFATLHTGFRPSEHGTYYPWEWSPDHQRFRSSLDATPPDAIWDRLGRAGRRSLVIDPYCAVPARTAETVAVCGWQLTNRVTLPRWSSPAPLYRELSRRFGKSQSADEVFGGARLAELLRFQRVLLEAPDRAAEATRELLARERFDLVWIEMVAPHLAGHQFWDAGQVIDLTKATESERRIIGTALLDVYEAADLALARILESLPDDADVMLIAMSGMAAERDRSDLLPGMLKAVLDGDSGAGKPNRAGGPLWSVRAALPPALRAQIARLVPDRAALEVTARLLAAGTDWSRTRAFAVPNDPCGAVRLNLRGRERDGIVDPTEAEELEREIEAGLLSFREPDGEAAVTAVERIADLEPAGPRSDLLPDLVVRWGAKPSTGLRFVESPEFGEVHRSGSGSGRSGNHSGGAWALLVPARARPRKLARQAEVVDIAATAQALLGTDAELDGLPGESLLEPA
jgi:predicted AlkP superfamily phosphohydrolase/phosphomutase